MRLKAELALAVAAMIWGSTFVVVKDALVDISPVLYLAVRFWTGSLILLLWIRKRPSRRILLGGMGTGVFLGFGMILQTMGLKFTSASNVGFLTSMYIPLVPFVGALVYGIRTGWRELVAVVVASVGIGLMSFDPSSLSVNRGDVMTVVAAVLFAFQIVLVTRFGVEGELAWLVWLQVTMVAIVSSLGLVLESSFVNWTMRLWWAFGITVLGATVAAFMLQSWGQRHTTATRAALIFALEPVFAGLASYFWLGERLTGRGWVGAGLVLLGVLLAELKPGGDREHSSR
ncbi:MAG: DMT family transporter [Acidobacteria bacterium]|nr:DMT family transporter [Acidobacteriota bacterium]